MRFDIIEESRSQHKPFKRFRQKELDLLKSSERIDIGHLGPKSGPICNYEQFLGWGAQGGFVYV